MTARAHRRATARGLAACGLAVVLLAGLSATAGAAPSPTAPATTAVVVLSPYLTWNDISAEKTPALWSLMDRAAIGNMNAHTAEYGWPTLAGGVLTLSASRWAKAPTGGPLEAASLDRARAANADSLAEPVLGSLGSAIRAAGGRRVAVGASDTDTSAAAGRIRAAELLATDESGTLDASYSDVLTGDPGAPFGLRTDPDKLAAPSTTPLRPGLPGGSSSWTLATSLVLTTRPTPRASPPAATRRQSGCWTRQSQRCERASAGTRRATRC